MKKKILTIVLCTLLMLCMFPATAMADSGSSVDIAGVTLDSAKPYYVNGAAVATGTLGEDGCTAFLDTVPTTSVLYINGLTITDYDGNGIDVKEGDLVIDISGMNNISVLCSKVSMEAMGYSAISAGDYATGSSDITIQGTGILNCASKQGDCLQLLSGDLIFNSGTVEAVSNDGHGISVMGLSVGKGRMYINGGSLTGKSTAYGVGVFTQDDIILDGGNLIAEISSATNTREAVRAFGEINIVSGKMLATSASSAAFIADEGFNIAAPHYFATWSENTDGSNATTSNDSYTYDQTHKYVKISDRYAVTFDANGGTGIMKDVSAVIGGSTLLPECSFTAPEGKEFKKWAIGSTDGTQVSSSSNYVFTGDTTVYAVWGDIQAETPTYTITAGANQSITAGKATDLTFTADGPLELLDKVYVNGTELDKANYTKESGSTIVTLKSDYLNTLTAGTYELKLTYTNGSEVKTNFTVAKADTTNPTDKPTTKDDGTKTDGTKTPTTGDTSSIGLWITLLVLAAGTGAVAYRKKTDK